MDVENLKTFEGVGEGIFFISTPLWDSVNTGYDDTHWQVVVEKGQHCWLL